MVIQVKFKLLNDNLFNLMLFLKNQNLFQQFQDFYLIINNFLEVKIFFKFKFQNLYF